jgi:RNA polymerase sigma-70 factor (ECF subfamily)
VSVETTTDSAPPREEAVLVAAVRAGDERAFMRLVDAYGAQMLRVAMMYVATRAVAEEVVQETWLAVLTGLDRFEGRSSLKTWIFRILTNLAKTRGARERRTMPFSSLAGTEDEGPTVDPTRFEPAHSRWAGHWTSYPDRWSDCPEARLTSRATLESVRQAIAVLPPNYRAVITLRDVEGWDAAEVCEMLGINDVNQRVLLHRARAKVRRALEDELREG